MMTPKRLAGELERRLDGPHTDEHTSAAADLAAESVRFLNYATGSHSPEALHWPSTVYEIAASLALAAERLPQLFDQLARWLHDEDTDGHLALDGGGNTSRSITDAVNSLKCARRPARDLAALMSQLQSVLADVNGNGPNRAGGAQ